MFDPASDELVRAWMDASVRTGALFLVARALDQLLRGRADADSRMWLYAPVGLALVLPELAGPGGPLPAVSRVVMGSPSPAPVAQPALQLPVLWLGWALGVTLLSLRAWQGHVAFLRRAASAQDAPELSRELGCTVRVHEQLGPLVYGVLYPTLVLPRSLAALPLTQTAECALAHELAHLRKRHLVFSALLQLVCITLWPLLPIWLASRRLHALFEQCADAEALTRLPIGPSAYGRALVGLDHQPPAPPGGFSMAAYADLRQRIEALARPARWSRALSLPVVFLTSALALGLAQRGLASDSPSQEASWIDLELGGSVLLTLPKEPLSVTVADPRIAEAVTLGDPRRVYLRAKTLGETHVTIVLPTGPLVYELNTVPATPPSKDPDVHVRPGETVVLKLPQAPASFTSSAPDIVEVRQGAVPGELEVVGRRAGRGEVLVLLTAFGTPPRFYKVLVE